MNRYEEQRQFPRIEVNTPAKITVVSSGLRISKSIPCVIVNISQGGALLAFTSPMLETDFFLEMDKTPPFRVSCCVVRRVGNNVGVKFYGSVGAEY
jgi:hypothetical protein